MTETSLADNPEGPQLGPYRIERELGRGGMAVVYQATDLRTNRQVAIKVLHAQEAMSDHRRRRTEIEIEALKALDHPNVVKILETGESGASTYLVLELVDGESLEARLRRGPLAIDEAIDLAHDLAGALAHAHEQGILHRDLKPENILRDPEGRVVLMDFGLALDLEASYTRISRTGRFLGTPGYWSPEQARGEIRDLTEATDVYGFGAVLYAALTSRPPVFAENLIQALESSRFKAIEAPSTIREEVPAWLSEICMRCLRYLPAARYESFVEIREALASRGSSTAGSSSSRTLLILAATSAALLLALAFLLGELSSNPEGHGPPAGGSRPLSSLGRPSSPQPKPESEPAPSSLPSVSLRVLTRSASSYAWLTTSPLDRKDRTISVLLHSAIVEDTLRVEVLRARVLRDGTIEDTLWSKEIQRDFGPGLLADFDLETGQPRAGSLASRRALEGSAARHLGGARGLGEVLRLLARADPDGVLRRGVKGRESWVWEPVVWAGVFASEGPSQSLFDGPSGIRARVASLLGAKSTEKALHEDSWGHLLTQNLARHPRAPFPFGESAALVIPLPLSEAPTPPAGSLQAQPRTPVFSVPHGLVLGCTGSKVTRYLTFGQVPGWIRIGWGGGLGWVRGTSMNPEVGGWARCGGVSLNVRSKPYLSRRSVVLLGDNPPIGQLRPGGYYPFTGKRGDLENPNPPLGEPRWAQIQFDDRLGWCAVWLARNRRREIHLTLGRGSK